MLESQAASRRPIGSPASRQTKTAGRGLAAALLIAAAAAAPALASQGAVNGRIAYGSDTYGNTHNIFSINADGSGVQQLTYLQNADGAALQASWSADGAKVVFRERPSDTSKLSRGLYLMNADGSKQHLLYTDPSNGEFAPSFSPDGTHVAFTLCPDAVSACAIYTIKTDGTALSPVTRLDARDEVFDFSPQYSPDGKTIAFAGFNRPEPDSVAVYLVNANGGAVRQITDTAFGASDPDWSPDGSYLVVTSEEAIWSMKRDGTDLVRLSSPARSHDGLARWSPDGTRIVFERDSPNFANYYVVTMNANGSNPTVVSSGATTADSFQPDWGTAP